MLARGREGAREKRDLKLRRQDGEDLWAIVSTAPLFDDDGRYRGSLALIADITKRVQAESEREELLAELQRRAEQTEDFIRMISHDLRQPLTIIQGMSQWLAGRLAALGLEREAGTAERVVSSGKRMASMIQDLVHSARLEAGQTPARIEATDVVLLVQEAIRQLPSARDHARVSLDANGWTARVLADPRHIERAILNLVTNALKYSPADAPVVVRVRQQGGEAVISVIDRGEGISPADQRNLFQRYYRAQTEKRAEGLGLGLYTARLIVEAHGGHIWCESEVGQGSTFSFTLPLAP